MRSSVAIVVHALILWLVPAVPGHADVRLEGLDEPIRSNVLAHMRLDDEGCDQDRARIRYRFSRSEDAIRAALKPFGYYDPEIEAELEEPEDDCWQAVFRVDPGEPVLISRVDIRVSGEGSGMPVFTRLLSETDIRVGERLEHDAYETLKRQLLVVAQEYGFFDAELVDSAMRVSRGQRLAEVSLLLDTGSRYRFGTLTISGDILDERLLLRYVDFQEGTAFEQRRLRKLHNDLVRGDYFSSVDVRAVPRENGDKVADVILTLEEGRRTRYGVGVGFGTDTGLVVRADFVQRRLNRSGHRLELDTELSGVRQNVTADYRIPGKRPQNDWYSFYTGVNREDTDALESIAWKLGVRENRFHTLSWSSTPFVELVVERFRQDSEWSQKTSLVPGWGVNYVTANAPARPVRGLRLRGEVSGAARKVLSDASFIRFYVSGKKILPLSERGRILVRGEAGWMATNDFDKVPPTWRFFAGGDRSVRGYDYQSLGPLDDEGKAIGGRTLVSGSIEGDWRVRERWSGALFLDAGNVGETDLLKDLPWSVGVGARWYSPVGPIRLDLAFPQNGTSDFRIHISMGPDL
jgi:translocation and assembly module TamA